MPICRNENDVTITGLTFHPADVPPHFSIVKHVGQPSMLCTFHDLFPAVKRCLRKILLSLACQVPCLILASLISKLAHQLNLLFAHLQIALHGNFVTEIAKLFRSADSADKILINQRPTVSCCKVACYAILSFLSRKPNSMSVISLFSKVIMSR